MPRGHKNKRHARKKRHQTRGEAQACKGVQETVEEIPEAAEKSSAASQSQPGADSSSTPEAPERATPSASSTLSISSIESHESSFEESDEFQEKESPVEDQPCTIRPHQEMVAGKVIVLLQYLLHNYNLKQFTTKEDMLKLLTKKYEDDFPEIFRKASQKLEDAFAMEVREVNSSNPTYNLISKLKLPNNGRIRAGKGFPKTAFVMCVLGIILVKGNCASEEEIWQILKTKRIYPGKKHCIFGEPRKLLTHYLVKLNYLEYRQVAGSDPPRYEFLWGPKAYAETSKVKVLEYLAKTNQTTPGAISALYEEVLKGDREQTEARDEDN
ncbi:melanoma-associated antigen B10-like [Peromyscus maniculatus bairdii]|uniref:melanoma-associated antigen B10-like n=1 Tax=Peromyscus maniculatus bairdii TaxID=230844 RepID=UPI00042AD56D|nr:melanoma-associated antigen B3-like [Peromyscus maniculatus bairdii]